MTKVNKTQFDSWESILRAKKAGKRIYYMGGVYELKRELVASLARPRARYEWILDHHAGAPGLSVMDDNGNLIVDITSFHT